MLWNLLSNEAKLAESLHLKTLLDYTLVAGFGKLCIFVIVNFLYDFL